ncbi:MAG: hypothetical protein PHF37_03250 [Phycisphaerae bacterium]|nr:hypothetical protein [Phycisphaerae bacterium]
MDEKTEQLIQDFKMTFGSEYGKRVFDRLKVICKYKDNQNIFNQDSERQTCFNLGAAWVCEYIQTQIDTKLDKPETDCQTEPEPQTESSDQ